MEGITKQENGLHRSITLDTQLNKMEHILESDEKQELNINTDEQTRATLTDSDSVSNEQPQDKEQKQRSWKWTTEGEVKYNNHRVALTLTESFMEITFTTSNKRVVCNWDDVVGVEPHKRVASEFILYTFQRPPKSKLRQQGYYIFKTEQSNVPTWISAIRCALAGLHPSEASKLKQRRITVCINPAGGSGGAKAMWKSVRDMFLIANIELTEIETTHVGHGVEIGKSLSRDTCDGVVCVSGDGLLHEVLNGLLKQKDWKNAVSIPIGAIPGGSGNALAASIDAMDPSTAAFYIVKDIWSVVHEGEDKYGEDFPRRYCFLGVTWGIIADVDRDSEKYRWMGGFRFTFTAAQKLIGKLKYYGGKITYLPAEFQKTNCTLSSCPTCENCAKQHASQKAEDEDPRSLKIINNLDKFKEQLVSIQDSFYLFAPSNLSMLSYDTKAAPYAHLSDGLIDLLYAKKLSTTKAAQFLLGLEEGKHVELRDIRYVKAKAVILEPETAAGHIMIDGERLPQVGRVAMEVHPGLVNVFVGT